MLYWPPPCPGPSDSLSVSLTWLKRRRQGGRRLWSGGTRWCRSTSRGARRAGLEKGPWSASATLNHRPAGLYPRSSCPDPNPDSQYTSVLSHTSQFPSSHQPARATNALHPASKQGCSCGSRLPAITLEQALPVALQSP